MKAKTRAVALFGSATVSVAVLAAVDPTLVNYVETGFDALGNPMAIPSIDPSGVTYHGPSGHLFIVDSEIDEVDPVWTTVGGNIFEVSPAGDVLYGVWNLYEITPRNPEPTGIVYNPFDGFFYAVHPKRNRIFRYGFDGTAFWFDDYQKHTGTEAGTGDPEGITADPMTGKMYVLDERDERIVPFIYDEDTNDFVFDPYLDLKALNDPANVPDGPQGIAFSEATGNLLLISRRDDAIFEFTTDGIYVDRFDLSAFGMIAPQGLTFGPTSDPGDAPDRMAMYVVDAGIDNNADPLERDGYMYELVIANRPPTITVNDVTVDEGDTVAFTVDASDPDPQDTLTLELIDGAPDGATFEPASGFFSWTAPEGHGQGSYLATFRVTDNGLPTMSAMGTALITVNEVNEPPTLSPIGDHEILVGTELTFDAVATDPDTTPAMFGGLVAYWPFDGTMRSATGVFDGTPVGDSGIDFGDAMLGGGALSLDGNKDHVDVGAMTFAGDFSVSMWLFPENIKPGKRSDATILGDRANNEWFRLEADRVRLEFAGDKRSLFTTPSFVNDAWQHFALVRSGGMVTVYRNGVEVGSREHPLPFSPEWIGKKKRSDDYEGLMDDMGIWDRALTSGEIATLYGAGLGNTVDRAGTLPTDTLTFSLEGLAPTGSSIDPVSGAFSWTAPAEPGQFTFAVRVTDTGNPTLFDEETITVTTVTFGGDDGPTTAASSSDATRCPDMNSDGWVDIRDLLLFLSRLGGTDGAGDFDGNGRVDYADLGHLADSWGPCP